MASDQAAAGTACPNLLPDLVANIHGRLSFLTRLAFAAVFHASSHACKPEAPWLVLPGKTPEAATLFSLADRCAATVRAPGPALRGSTVIGSSGGWLVTADVRGRMHLVNPVSGEQHALPAITTVPCVHALYGGSSFVFQEKPFRRGPPYPVGLAPCGTFTLTAGQMRRFLYRKVVLSASPRPDNYAAMLITCPRFGVPAFATAEDPAWRLAPSRDGVEDAIHHKGRFYSVTCSGFVESWEHNAGDFTSSVVTPRLANADDYLMHRKYLVVAPGGRLMVVLKSYKETPASFYYRYEWTCSFKVQVLADDEVWKETRDIGDAALFVGVNNSLYVSTREHPELKAGCIYYTDDELGKAELRKHEHVRGSEEERRVGVFSLEHGTVEKIEALEQHQRWTPPAWFTPSIP